MKKKAGKKSKLKAKAKPKAKAKAKKPARSKSPVKAKAKAKPPKKAKATKKKAKKAAKPAPAVVPPPGSILVGRVEDFYAQINVVAFTAKKPIQVGDRLHVLGHTTRIEQLVDSMQINHQTVTQASAGDAIGIKVGDRARRGDYIFITKA
jgi:hypothetical protein